MKNVYLLLTKMSVKVSHTCIQMHVNVYGSSQAPCVGPKGIGIGVEGRVKMYEISSILLGTKWKVGNLKHKGMLRRTFG